jgi:acyl-CoA thioesterase
MWRADAASRSLDMQLVSVEPGRAQLRMAVRPDMANGHGIAHGGLLFALADSAFAFACNSYGPVTVAHSASIRFLTPVPVGAELMATAVERSLEGRHGVYDVEIRHGDLVVAVFQGRSTRLREGAEETS